MRLILAHASIHPRRLARYVPQEGPAAWIYVGRNYCRMGDFERQFPSCWERKRLGSALHSHAYRQRRPFLKFIYEQMAANDPETVWSSCFFENTTVHSTLFLHVCYLEVIKELLLEAKMASLVVIAEKGEFLDALVKNGLRTQPSGPIVEVVWVQRARLVFERMKEMLEIGARPIAFIVDALLECVLARVSRIFSRRGPDLSLECPENVLLRSWVAGSTFDDRGTFGDRHLIGLAEWLTANGFHVLRLPIGESGCIRSMSWMVNLRKPQNRFLVPWDYLRLRDILRTLVMNFEQCKIRWRTDRFEGHDISPLLRAERRRYALARRGMHARLQALLVERLRNRGVSVARFIYPFENMLPEKLFIRAVRKHYPKVPLIGFQHSALFPLKLDLYVHGQVLEELPLPDRIVCSGRMFQDILLREYAPFRNIEIGPALRFAHLFEPIFGRKRQPHGTVLIALPGYLSEATELMTKVIATLRSKPSFSSVLVKPHWTTPLRQLQALITFLGGASLNLQLVTEPLRQLFGRSDVMVTLASGVVLDAVAAGLPVVRVRRDTDLDMDPLDWIDFPKEFSFLATTVDELRAEILRALDLKAEERSRLIKSGRNFVDWAMGPLTDEQFRVFVN